MTVLVNNTPIKTFNFSGGECHVALTDIPIGGETDISAFLNNSDAVMQLILSVDAVRRVNPDTAIDLYIPYFPYARQDRVCNPGEALSAAVMAGLINALACRRVTIEDLHSKITAGLIDRVQVITQSEIIASSPVMRSLITEKNLTLIAPDAGAAEKSSGIAAALLEKGITVKSLFAKKVRNVADGKITDTIIPEGIAGKNLLIPDDICDGGATFTELAKKLKANGAGDLYLYVTHGIFSKGLEPLQPHFKHVYCRNSFIGNANPEFLTVLETAS